MNCKSCALVVKNKDAKLGCYGTCGNVFHLSCLGAKNDAYKQSVIKIFTDIPNLLWFCDDCLPNIQDIFSASSEHTQLHNGSLNDLVAQSTDQKIDDSVSQTPMDTENSPTIDESVATNSKTKAKRARSCSPTPSQPKIDDPKRSKTTDTVRDNILFSDLVIQRASKPDNNENISSLTVNSRCIYITPFNPVTDESQVVTYLNSQDNIRDFVDKIKCKKLVSAKCNPKKLTFVSFKLSVPAECFDEIVNKSVWPTGVIIKEFIVRDKPKRIPTAQKNSKQLRFNPFSIRKPVHQISSANQNKSKSNAKTNNAKNGNHSSFKPSFSSQPNRSSNKALPQRKNFRAPFNTQPKRQHHHQHAHQRTSQVNQSQNQAQSLLALQLLQNVIPLLSALSPLNTIQTRK